MMSSTGTCEPRVQEAKGTSSEVANKLAQMHAERGRQDQMWSQPITSHKPENTVQLNSAVTNNNGS
jgi:hypothetical protein